MDEEILGHILVSTLIRWLNVDSERGQLALLPLALPFGWRVAYPPVGRVEDHLRSPAQ